MKKLLCSDLGGPSECTVEITGSSFEDVAKNCQAHVMEEISKGDDAHEDAVGQWKDMTPEDQQSVMAEFQKKWEDAKETY